MPKRVSVLRPGSTLLKYVTNFMGFDGWNFSRAKVVFDESNSEFGVVFLAKRLKSEPLHKGMRKVVITEEDVRKPAKSL